MRIRISRSVVPNLFTVLNIFFGFLCILHAMHGRYVLASWYVFFSALCDTLDGMMARLTRSASEFGVELDSLADVVSFGAAPSVLLYALFLHQYGPFGTLVAAAPLLFGALRLARFNVQLVGFHKDHFVGVPIPLAALTLVSFIQFFTPATILADATLQRVFIGLILAAGLLMVSTLSYPVLPKFSRKGFREHPVQVSLLLAAAVVVVTTMGRALFPVLVSIIASGIVIWLVRKAQRLVGKRTGDQEEHSPYPIDSH